MVSLPPPGLLCGDLACEAKSAPTAPTGSTASAARVSPPPTNTEQPTMTKAEMIQRIAQELGCTTAQAAGAVEAILTTVKASLQQGEPVILRRFGTWQVHAKRARVGRNPKTGTAAAIPARRVVRFTAGKPFKQAVDGAAHLVE
jgi:integration host factor subunit alpha